MVPRRRRSEPLGSRCMKTGEVTVEQFERVLHTLGVRYTPEQVERLFKVLDADDNNKVSLEELLLLKTAIDNDVTELPARPSLEESERGIAIPGPPRGKESWPPRNLTRLAHIDHEGRVPLALSAFGVNMSHGRWYRVLAQAANGVGLVADWCPTPW